MYTVYGKPDCPFCSYARLFLIQNREEYEYIDISEYPEEAQRLKSQGFKTVPQIWHNDVHVGGYEDLEVYYGKQA